MDYQKKILSNGLRLIMVPMDSVKSVTAHFLEHMAFKGTQKRPTAMAISSLIDGVGGEFNAFTSKEVTGFYIKSAATHFPLAIDVLSDILLYSKFEEEEINKERGVILEEINLYEDTPMRKVSDIYEELLYGDTPLGWDTAGRKEVIRKINRSNFLSYLKSFYSPQNMVVVVAGSFKSDEVQSLVNKFLGEVETFETAKYIKILEKQVKPEILVKFKQTEQAHLCLGVRTFPYSHPDRHILAVLATILGGGMSSRLFHEVREKRGLAYYVRTSSDHFLDAGTLVTQAGVDLRRIEEAGSVILAEYRRMIEEICQKEEILKAKEYLKGHLILELEDSRGVASLFGSQEILETKIRTPEEIIEEIDRVTSEDIQRVAREIFSSKSLNLAVIGPFKDGKKFEKILKL